MSGASGKVPAAIHMCPEALKGGPLAFVRDGDMITLDATQGTVEVDAELASRSPAPAPVHNNASLGMNMFANQRAVISEAEEGASVLGWI